MPLPPVPALFGPIHLVKPSCCMCAQEQFKNGPFVVRHEGPILEPLCGPFLNRPNWQGTILDNTPENCKVLSGQNGDIGNLGG